MDVLEAGQVPAYDDQVQVALVLLVVRRDGVPVRADDREVDPLPPLAGLRLGQAERVTVRRRLEAAHLVLGHAGHAFRTVRHPTVVRIDGIRGHRSDPPADPECHREHCGAPGHEPEDPGHGVHVSV